MKNYKEYLQSEHWKEKRQQALAHHGRKCKKCDRFKNLNVHHKTYERIGAELLEDLVILCALCHKLYHRIYGRKPTDESLQEFLETINTPEEIKKLKKELKEDRKKKKKKKLWKTTYKDKKGKNKRLSKKSIKEIRAGVFTEPNFDFINKQMQQNLNKKR